MKAHRALFPIRAMYRVLGLSPSGYYAWLGRPPSARSRRDDELRVLVRRSWQASRRTYGRPRIHADLKAQGVKASPKRIARIMREEGIEGASRRRSKAVEATAWRTPTADMGSPRLPAVSKLARRPPQHS